ncbi:hypothetical protein VI817_009902 [Penicillium citrinum]|nr:hypothetical protein VI817_009902 [Penicillium citrinum]
MAYDQPKEVTVINLSPDPPDKDLSTAQTAAPTCITNSSGRPKRTCEQEPVDLENVDSQPAVLDTCPNFQSHSPSAQDQPSQVTDLSALGRFKILSQLRHSDELSLSKNEFFSERDISTGISTPVID